MSCFKIMFDGIIFPSYSLKDIKTIGKKTFRYPTDALLCAFRTYI